MRPARRPSRVPASPVRPGRSQGRHPWLVGLGIVALAAAAYVQVHGFQFINLDDPDYVTANPHVLAGLRLAGVAWAFRDLATVYWLPLTWIVHMADVSAFGLESGAHHLVNVVIHLLSVAVLFGVLLRTTRRVGPSAFVAAVFALHPLQVESVAWVAELKNVLCGLFWMLTLAAYVRYAARPTRGRYLVVVAAFGGALMAKPMAVTLPLTLLLFDRWPLGRDAVPPDERRARWTGLVVEKIPLFAMSLVVSVLTVVGQREAGALVAAAELPWPTRLAHATAGLGAYLLQAVVPVRLSVYYPLPAFPPLPLLLTSAAVLVGVTVVAVRARTRPYLLVGWLWFLINLIPVSGLVQAGAQARADRFMYIPIVGLALALSWTAADFAADHVRRRAVASAAAVALVVAMTITTWQQARVWQSSVTLFQHAIAVDPANPIAHNALGLALRATGDPAGALDEFREAVRLQPRFAGALTNLGDALMATGQIEAAMAPLSAAIAAAPSEPRAYVNLGYVLDRLGRSADAVAMYRAGLARGPAPATAHEAFALALAHEHADADALSEMRVGLAMGADDAAVHLGAGTLLAVMGRAEDAALQFQEAIRLSPSSADARMGLGNLLAGEGRVADAAAEFRDVTRLQPGNAGAHANLGTALAQLGRLDEAIDEFTTALRLDPGQAEVRRNLQLARDLRDRGR